MLYASKSTLENAEDGTILAEEYHLKLDTESGFRYQVSPFSNSLSTLNMVVVYYVKFLVFVTFVSVYIASQKKGFSIEGANLFK